MDTKEQSAEAEGMLDVAELRKIYAEKLAATDSLDAAFLKAVWVAFKRGIAVTGPEQNAAPLAQRDSAVNSLRSLEAHYQKTHDAMREAHRQLDLVTGALEALESKGWLRRLEKEADHKHVAGTDPALELKRDVANARAALAAVRKPAGSPAGEGGES